VVDGIGVNITAPPAQAPTRLATESSARALLARREDPLKRALRFLALLVSLAILVLAWQVTGVDLRKLTNATSAGPILTALVTPDVVARDTRSVELTAPLTVGAPSDQPDVTSSGSGQTLRITPAGVEAGQTVAFEGSGFEPNGQGQIRLVLPDGRDLLFTRDLQTDSRGNFREERQWPASTTLPPGTYTVRLLLNAPIGSLRPSETLSLSLSRIGETILLALMGTVFGVLFSIPLSFLGARNLMSGSPVAFGIYYVIRLLFTITRSIEVLILGVIMVVIVGIGSYAGVLAIVVHSIGSLGKLYSEAIESIEPGPVEAITATGADKLQTVVASIVPQVIPEFLAVTIYWWDHNVRMSTVLGLVGGGGIGYLLIQYINLLQYQQAATVLWMIVIVVMAMDYASAAIRQHLV
jgi:phosphonate transport system permease protein